MMVFYGALGVCGCVALFLLLDWLLVRKHPDGYRGFLVVPMCGGAQNIEQRLRFAFEQARRSCADGIIVADCGLCSDAAEICLLFCREHAGVRFCKADALCETLCLEAR